MDYIVQNTVGQLLEQCRAPEDVTRIKLLDPACGSGSFLLGAYQALIDWHKNYYAQKSHWDKKDREAAYHNGEGQVRLTAKLKRQILLNNIFGVDIDPQAVEVTRFSLSLKALEETRRGELYEEVNLFKQTVLPDLRDTIKCGNSLIGPDYFAGQLISDTDDLRRVNPFDWEREFPPPQPSPAGGRGQGGGFDCVIGNPPYLFITELDEQAKRYFFNRYETSEYRFDVYGLFIELAIKRLVKSGGYLSFIIPHTLLSNDSFAKLRKMMIDKTLLQKVVDIGPGIFAGAKNETMILIARNETEPTLDNKTQIILTTAKTFPCPSKQFSVYQCDWGANPGAAWLVKVSENEAAIVAKLESVSHHLGEICTINQGLRTGDNEKYLSNKRQSGKWKPAAGGKHVDRYEPLVSGLYVYYEPELLDAPRRRELFESSEKLVVQEIRNITLPRRLIATCDDQQFYCLQSTNVINLRGLQVGQWNIKFLLGILNSVAANFFFRQRFSGNNHIASNQLAKIPIPSADRDSHDRMVALVTQMLDLHKRLAAKTQRDRELYQRQIDATDREIDALVYELYGLTKSEIAVIESQT